MDSDKERVVFVEFNSDGSPYEVITDRAGYDFAMSKKFGLLYHESGGSSSSTGVFHASYWASPDVTVEEVGRCIRLETLPDAYTPEKLFDAIECTQQMVWCSACDDWMPDEPESFCEHVWYCVECCEISTPDERCECKKEEEESISPRRP